MKCYLQGLEPKKNGYSARSHRPGNFVAVDGESTTEDGHHRYVIMGASTGSTITRKRGIPTVACFDYLLRLKRDNPKATFVAFFFSYDITMMLRDMPPVHIAKLYKEGYVRWKGYKVSNTTRKFFTVKCLTTDVSVRLNDTSGFFQCSFVKALEMWKIGSPALIADMKSRRSQFKASDIPQMRRYCVAECKLLVTMMRALEQSLLDAGIKASGWYGAGCIASAILRQHGVKYYRQLDTNLDLKVQDALLRSYFGGRVETFYVGQFGRTFSHDVRSAYPAAISTLPSSIGQWRRVSYVPDYGICYVNWSLPARYNIGPFPHRSKRKIYYPANGEGFYHATEVRAAMGHYSSYIRVHYSYQFEPEDSGVTPFSFVPELYRQRAEAKRLGNASQLSLKLGLNSLYGKMAQGYGYKGSIPPFRTYYWAGQITATTRSAILNLVAQEDEDQFIGFATDGIMMRSKANVKESEDLGDWEVSEWEDLFVAQPGFYHGNTEGKTVTKSRGFAPKEIDWDEIRQGYRQFGPYYQHEIMSTRFIGLGAAIQRNNLALRGKWLTEPRRISLYPQRKFVTHNFPMGHTFKEPTRFDIMRGDNFNTPSDPYTPKGGQFQELLDAYEGFVTLHEQPRGLN